MFSSSNTLPRSNVKSTQRGSVGIGGGGSLTADATISSVDITKCSLRWLGCNFSQGGAGFDYPNWGKLTLLNATTIRWTVVNAPGASNGADCSWELTEYY